MLTLTDEAKDIVREMVSAEGGDSNGGLRIAAGDGELSLSVASEPADGDAVIDADGTRVFLEPAAASLLDDKVLDAHRHDDHVHFSLHEQDG